jgi:hypothetical protein
VRPSERPFPPHVAAHVLHHFGAAEGYPAGSFITALIALMTRADPDNLVRLTFGFPEYGRAVRVAQHGDDGMAYLREVLATSEDEVKP